MHLTREEERILKGESGEGTRKAMELLVAIGDAYDAPRLIEVSRAHAASSGQEGDLYFVELLAKGGATCKVPTSTNPVYDMECFDKMFRIPKEDSDVARRVMKGYKQIGAILSWCCTPYITENIPMYGENVSFSESSATPFVNTVIGARTNREAAQSALAAGVVGKTPEYGLYFEENRRGTAVVKVNATLRDEFDYSLLGQYVGKQIGYGIPVFTGISRRPSTEEMINLCAMLNTSGAIPMFHIPGITVEAPTLKEAFGGNTPKQEITVTGRELKETQEDLQTASGKVDIVQLGCPHYTLKQVVDVARLLQGKRIHRGVSFWICTSATALFLAERMGYVDAIEKAAGYVVADTCIDMVCWNGFKDKVGMTDSPKCAYYRRFKDVIVARLPDCVKAAVEGEWH
ncbi:MAG TPA: aconitase X catalytic domain-containing protein [Candidatus Bathyarchaeia archaeon]|nr:aconitase X catalytic domain-containing protein [Candidatus Bathyarchaeia archaeon]